MTDTGGRWTLGHIIKLFRPWDYSLGLPHYKKWVEVLNCIVLQRNYKERKTLFLSKSPLQSLIKLAGSQKCVILRSGSWCLKVGNNCGRLFWRGIFSVGNSTQNHLQNLDLEKRLFSKNFFLYLEVSNLVTITWSFSNRASECWKVLHIKSRTRSIITTNGYSWYFCMLPIADYFQNISEVVCISEVV